MDYTVGDLFFALIRAEICGIEPDTELIGAINDESATALYKLSKPQDLAHLIADALLSRGLVQNSELLNLYKKEQMTAVFRHAQIRHELTRLCRALDRAGIDHLILKGSFIRRYYPRPEQRTSCDIDIFVRDSDLDAASTVMTDVLGYRFDIRTPHDIAYYSPSKVHIELHFDLIENDERVRDVLSRVWEYSHLDGEDTHGYVMTNEMFMVYHFAHMAKHFAGGGCGVRPFIDLWIAEKKMGYDKDTVFSMLRECGLDKFAEAAIELTEVWLSGNEHCAITAAMEEYILGSAIYGTMENRVTIQQAKRGGKVRYMLGRIFMPYEKLKKIYPNLEKYPILLPFYQVKRWCRYFSRRGTSRAKIEAKIAGNISEEKQIKMVSMLKELGLND